MFCCCNPRPSCCCCCTCTCTCACPPRPLPNVSGQGCFVGPAPVTVAAGGRAVFPLGTFETKSMGVNRANNALVVKRTGCYELGFNAIFNSLDDVGGYVYIFDGTRKIGETGWHTPVPPEMVSEAWSGPVRLTAGTELTLIVEGLGAGSLELLGGTITAKLVGDSACV